MRWLIVLLVLALSAAVHAQRDATVEQPRAFGYVIGDLVTQRVLLDDAFDIAELPRPARFGVWFERRAARIAVSADERRWLVVDYQVINAPQALTAVTLPAWSLKSASGDALVIAAWPVSVSPLTPRAAFAVGDLQALRPDRNAERIATTPIMRRLTASLAALGATIAAWVAWVVWRNWRASLTQPFARALRELRAIDESTPQAWQALHAAFDRTAGRVIQVESLPILFTRAPYLAPQRAQIESFFAQSTARFFGSDTAAAPAPLRALCVDLRRLEQRSEP